jgi:tetratricopeptide (TPR) repeat protein
LITDRLNGLPLALTQAGSYLRQTNMAVSTYVKYYDSTWRDLMEKHDRFPLQEYGDRSVLTTWKMSYEQVQSQSEEAAGLLRLWGFLDCGDLWYELVASASRVNEIIKTPDWLLRLVENELEFLSSLQLLSRYSLVDAKEDASSHSMHAVLHEWCCHLAEGGERSVLSWLAASIVAQMIPDESELEYWKLRKRLLPHGSRVQRWIDDERLEQLDGANGWIARSWIYYFLGVLFAHQGKLVEAEKLYLRALQGYEKALGAEHTITLDVVTYLGNLYRKRGKLVEADKMYMQALQGYEKALGAEHTSTLVVVGNLGNLYSDQGKLVDAEKMYMRALQGYEKALGAEHTSTLDVVNNLGNLYNKQGKLVRAEEMFMQALQGYENALGVENVATHKPTLNTVTNLGYLYRDQAKLAEAESMFSRALIGFQATLGPSHETCQRLSSAITSLSHFQGTGNEILVS